MSTCTQSPSVRTEASGRRGTVPRARAWLCPGHHGPVQNSARSQPEVNLAFLVLLKDICHSRSVEHLFFNS